MLRSITQRDPNEWLPFHAGPGGTVMDPRFLRAVERSMGDTTHFWNVIVREASGKPLAAAVLSLFPIDGLLFLQEPWKGRMERLRRLLPNFLRVKVLFCGLPVSTGESHLRFGLGVAPLPVLRALDGLMTRIARTNGTHFLVFKEFGPEEIERADALTSLGYLRADSPPMNYFPPRFRDFEDFLAAVRSRYRNQIKRSQKKFEASNLRAVHLRGAEGPDRLFTDDVYRLYLSVLERAEVKLECLPADFFRELARQFPEDSSFTFVLRGERIVAFVCGLFHGTEYLNLFCGLDHALNEEVDLYFNLMYHDLDFALRRGVNSIHVGQTANDFKSRMGCFTRPRHFYVKARDRLVGRLLHAAAPWLFPPTPPVPDRNLFR